MDGLAEFLRRITAHVDSLVLPNCGISDELACSLAMLPIRVFSLPSNNIGSKGAEKFGANPSLTSLDISFNPIGNRGAILLSANSSLEELNLSGSGISDEGVSAVATLPNLKRLYISDAAISSAGACALVGVRTLTHLSVANTQITDADVVALAQGPALQMLDISGIRIRPETIRFLQTLEAKLNICGLSGYSSQERSGSKHTAAVRNTISFDFTRGGGARR